MDETVVYQGKKIRLVTRTETLPSGTSLAVAFIRHPGAVLLLPFVDAHHICLIRNYRRAVGETLWELPAGTLDPNETPVQCAARELMEETGYRAGRLELVRQFFPSPGLMDERMYLFHATELTAGPPCPDVGEQLEARVVPFRQAIAWALDGTIRDGKSLVALLLWDQLARHLDG